MVGHYLQSYGRVRAREHVHVHDNDMEMISVKFFVYSSRSFAITAHLALLMQFAFVFPCHAYQHFARKLPMSMSLLNFSEWHEVLRCQYARKMHKTDWLEQRLQVVWLLGKNYNQILGWKQNKNPFMNSIQRSNWLYSHKIPITLQMWSFPNHRHGFHFHAIDKIANKPRKQLDLI